MAFNPQTFKTRATTAVIFVIVMAVGLLWNRWSFFILFSIVHFGCWIEYQRLVALFNEDYKKISFFHKWGVMLASWCLMLFFTNDELQVGGVHLKDIGWWLGLAFVI